MFVDIVRLLFSLTRTLAIVAALFYLVLKPPIWLLLPLALALG
jgi:hypothetical protein